MSDLTPKTMRDRIAAARLPKAPADRRDRARRLLLAWADTAAAHGATGRQIARAMRDGSAAAAVSAARRSQIDADPPEVLKNAACAPGCAFCCVLSGEDGGTITESEARALHTALVPHAGTPDGRDWRPDACPALDPEDRLCRAFGSRPSLCNAYISTDVAACETNANGGRAKGGGILGNHIDLLTVLALSRAALKGIAQVQTYALRDVAAAAVAGQDIDAALAAARHPPGMLDKVGAGAAALGYSDTSSPSGPTITRRPPR